MIQKTVHKLLKHRHFWREIGFDELSELYTSMLLRSLATNLIGLFVPIYLYKQGYSLHSVFLFYILFFGMRIVLDVVAAYVVGRIGPKHTIVLSTIATVINLLLLLTIKTFQWPLVVVALTYASAASLFFIAFHTDYSKVKDTKHGGKELGYLMQIEKVTGIVGPLVGGFIATVWGAHYTILLAIGIMLSSLWPLFASNEPVKLHQKISFKKFTWQKHTRSMASYVVFNTENTVCTLIWVLYISLAIFTKNTYAKLGIVTAISMAVSLFFTHYIGVRIDKKDGRKLLTAGVVANACVHLLRLLVTTPLAVVGVNSLNDPVTVAYRMPYAKNFYDFSDHVPGYRIVFIAMHESVSQIGKALLWVWLYVASMHMLPTTAMKYTFVLAVFLSLAIALQPKGVNNLGQYET